ncbi:hypothetical protein D3C87_2031850 [compost metagenome]
MTAIDDITCSLATNPCIADTVAPQLFVPSIGLNIQDTFSPTSARILSSIFIPYSNLNENDNKNHITIEHSSIIVPALLINSITLSNTSFNT